MSEAYDKHATIATEVEEARQTIEPLPELFRGVKVRKATIVLAYLNLVLVVLIASAVVVYGTLVTANWMKGFMIHREMLRNPPPTFA
jgi:hypothetical protein